MYVPKLGDRVDKRGNRFTRAVGQRVGRAILWLFRYRFRGEVPNLEKFLVAVAPHTTAWDFGIGVAAMLALGVRVHWLGINWIFKYPFMRSLGGIPVDRTQRMGLVERSIQNFATHDRYILAIAPEGSRKKTRWKKGFHRIASGADVPILLVSIDHKAKDLHLGDVVHPTGDYDADMARIRPFFEEFLEKYPDRFQM
jgi:1-acyl-sn-glycerol-3-phosphate acyltransferase